jgi:hypothetical protein
MSQDASPGVAKELTSPRKNAQSASDPGLASWDILSRPSGTVRRAGLTQDWRPGLLSVVPSGLD